MWLQMQKDTRLGSSGSEKSTRLGFWLQRKRSAIHGASGFGHREEEEVAWGPRREEELAWPPGCRARGDRLGARRRAGPPDCPISLTFPVHNFLIVTWTAYINKSKCICLYMIYVHDTLLAEEMEVEYDWKDIHLAAIPLTTHQLS
ncbi:hypothetical protein ABZP36_005557 [Zizania latifolia]